MQQIIASVLVSLLTPIITCLVNAKNTAMDARPTPHRERWNERVRKFKSSIRK